MSSMQKWLIVTPEGRVVGNEIYNTRIRAEHEIKDPTHMVKRLKLVSGMVRHERRVVVGEYRDV